MNKAKKNNRPLILSIISIMLCVVLLIGATIAWFTDTETNKGNVIQAGNLDVDVVWYEVDDSKTGDFEYTITNEKYDKTYSFTFSDIPNDFDGETPMISETNWQSGDYSVKLIEVTNKGSLDVNITLNAVAEDLGLEDALWYDFIQVDTASTETTGTFDVRAMSSLTTLMSQVTKPLGGTTADSDSETLEFILIYGMLDSADNTYQEKGYTADIFLTATQANATDTVVYASTVDEINSATTNQTVILMNDITESDDVELTTNVNFDLNGYTLTVDSFTMSTQDYCTVDIVDGYIVATTGNIDIQIPNGTINADDTIFAANSGDKIIIDASKNTVNIMGSTNFVATVVVDDVTVAGTTPVSPTLNINTTVNMSGTNDIDFNVPDGTGVTINNTGTGTATATGAGSSYVTYLENGEEVPPTASEQFILDLQNAVTGDTVKLTGDVVLGDIYILGKAINIDLGEYSLTVDTFVMDYTNEAETDTEYYILGAKSTVDSLSTYSFTVNTQLAIYGFSSFKITGAKVPSNVTYVTGDFTLSAYSADSYDTGSSMTASEVSEAASEYTILENAIIIGERPTYTTT